MIGPRNQSTTSLFKAWCFNCKQETVHDCETRRCRVCLSMHFSDGSGNDYGIVFREDFPVEAKTVAGNLTQQIVRLNALAPLEDGLRWVAESVTWAVPVRVSHVCNKEMIA